MTGGNFAYKKFLRSKKLVFTHPHFSVLSNIFAKIMICPDYQETEKHPKVTARALMHDTMDSTDKASLFKTVTQKTRDFFLPQPILHHSAHFLKISNYI